MTVPGEVLRRLLDYLEPKIDLSHVAEVRDRHLATLRYQTTDRPPLVTFLPYEGEDFQPYP